MFSNLNVMISCFFFSLKWDKDSFFKALMEVENYFPTYLPWEIGPSILSSYKRG